MRIMNKISSAVLSASSSVVKFLVSSDFPYCAVHNLALEGNLPHALTTTEQHREGDTESQIQSNDF